MENPLLASLFSILLALSLHKQFNRILNKQLWGMMLLQDTCPLKMIQIQREMQISERAEPRN